MALFYLKNNHLKSVYGGVISFLLCLDCVFAAAPDSFDKEKVDGEMGFDIQELSSLGYDEKVAEFFNKQARYLPGQYTVALRVNYSDVHMVTVTIGGEGELCVNKELLQELNFKVDQDQEMYGCPSLQSLYPGAKVITRPNKFEIDILLDNDLFDKTVKRNNLLSGGSALISNYRVYGMHIKGWNTQEFYQGQFETGINLDNWVLRNNSSFSSGNNSSEYQFNETTLSHSVESLGAQLQVGQISMRGGLFGGTPLLGGQLYSDSSLQYGGRLIVPITGFVDEPATIEVNQNGRLLYRALLPAGPYKIEYLNQVIAGQPLNVSTVQSSGQKKSFNVVSSLENGSKRERYDVNSFHFGLGRYRNYNKNDDSSNPAIVSAEIEGGLSDLEYSTGVLASSPYQTVGGRVNKYFGDGSGSVNFGLLESIDGSDTGSQVDAGISKSVHSLSFGFSSLFRTSGYSTIDAALSTNDSDVGNVDDNGGGKEKITNSAFLGWSDIDLGSFGYSIGYTRTYGDDGNYIYHNFNYGNKFKSISLNAALQLSKFNNGLFLNFSIPLNKRESLNIQSQKYKDNDASVIGNYSNRLSDFDGFSIGAGRSNNRNVIRAAGYDTSAYTKLAASGSLDGDRNNSIMISASGSLAYIDSTLVTSPNSLGDTFVLLRIPGTPGVRVDSLGGRAVTNHWGTAVIPSLPANRKTTVQLDTSGLPLNLRLQTTSFDLAVARGSVVVRNIPVMLMKQLLLTVKLKNGQFAPFGTSVINKNGKFLGVVMNSGSVMLSNDNLSDRVFLRFPNAGSCEIIYVMPEEFRPNNLYEESEGECR
ncbi:fimbria/pilus outer membrane usher protein [Serratia marcescens]|uniref:fimbria/pilus outer membrane usher protein n=1 Tax=Serratia marcescens TaxID=615 RepID=UPI0015F33C85|nr:fimbria/pilus outer membrane usher protein [Serratia marcescens]